jgi:hypothetical protein
MTITELNDRARQRSIDEHLHTFRVSEGAFLVKSRAYAPGSHHFVTVNPRTGDVTHCSNCPGWHYRQSCTHAQAVERRLEREGRKSQPAQNLDGFRSRSSHQSPVLAAITR